MIPSRPWSSEELAFLAECANAKIAADVIAPLIDRSVAAVRMKRHNLGLEPPSGPQYHVTISPVGLPTVAKIKRSVAEHFKVDPETMAAPSRLRAHTAPRQVAMFFARELSRKSYPRIGELFGGRDHTTVIHAVRRVSRMMSEDDEFRTNVERARSLILSPENTKVGDNSIVTPVNAEA